MFRDNKYQGKKITQEKIKQIFEKNKKTKRGNFSMD